MNNLEKYNITEAKKQKTTIKLLMSGEAGAGKTMSALILATGLNTSFKKKNKRDMRVLLVDTEGGSSQVYADNQNLIKFDCLDFTKIFAENGKHHPKNYIGLFKDIASSNAYDLVIVDSISHEWSGSGGVLEMVAEASKGSKANGFQSWNVATKVHNRFVDNLIQLPCHLICLARSKMDINDNLKIEQRKTFEFESYAHFHLVHNVQSDIHYAIKMKDRTGIFSKEFKITTETGEQLMNWHDSGEEPIEIKPLKADVKHSDNFYVILEFIKETKATFEDVVNQFPADVLNSLNNTEQTELNKYLKA